MTANAHEIIQEIQAKAFQEGWDTLAQKIAELLKGGKPQQVIIPVKKPKKKSFKPGTAAAKVYDYIKDNPGLAAKDIIANTRVDDKAARTTLHRMKVRGIALNENGKWRIL